MKTFGLLIFLQYFIHVMVFNYVQAAENMVAYLTHHLINNHNEDELDNAPPIRIIMSQTQIIIPDINISFHPWKCKILYLYGNRIVIDAWSGDSDENENAQNWEIFGSFNLDSNAQFVYNQISAGENENFQIRQIGNFPISRVYKFYADEVADRNRQDLIATNSYLWLKTVTIDDEEVKTYVFKGIEPVENSNREITFLIAPPEDFFLVDMLDNRLVLYLTKKNVWKYVLYFEPCSYAESYREAIKRDIPKINYIRDRYIRQELTNLIWKEKLLE